MLLLLSLLNVFLSLTILFWLGGSSLEGQVKLLLSRRNLTVRPRPERSYPETRKHYEYSQDNCELVTNTNGTTGFYTQKSQPNEEPFTVTYYAQAGDYLGLTVPANYFLVHDTLTVIPADKFREEYQAAKVAYLIPKTMRDTHTRVNMGVSDENVPQLSEEQWNKLAEEYELGVQYALTKDQIAALLKQSSEPAQPEVTDPNPNKEVLL